MTADAYRAGCGYPAGRIGVGQAYYTTGCSTATQWNQYTEKCDIPCSEQPPLDGGLTRTAGSFCSGGCNYNVSTANASTFQSNGGPITVYSAAGSQPTGESCTVGVDPAVSNDNQLCAPLGAGQTACRKQNGDVCYSASTGRQICWQPGQTGEQTDADTMQKRNAGDQPIPPDSLQLPNGDTLSQSGEPVTTNTTINNNGDTRNVTTTTTNYETGSGTNAGDTNSGEPGDGSGDGSGDGEGDGDGEGPGAPSEGVGDIYEGEGRTVADAFGEFKTRVMAAPIMGAGTQFLTVSVSGSCPVFTVPATDYWDVLTFDYHCSGALADALALGAYLLLAVAAYTAFKVALY